MIDMNAIFCIDVYSIFNMIFKAVNNACKKDPRRDWRSLVVRTDLNGKITYYSMNNFKGTQNSH